MYNKEIADEILEVAIDLNMETCVVGSSVYLPEGHTPSDLDIFVARPQGYTDLFNQLLCLDDFHEIKKDSLVPAGGYIGMKSNIIGSKYLSYKGIEVNIVGWNGQRQKDLFVQDVIGSFDYGVTMIGYTHGYDHKFHDPRYAQDHLDRTLTLYNVYSEYHLARMGERLAKLQQRFPLYKVAITKDFYKGGNAFKKDSVKKSLQLYDNAIDDLLRNGFDPGGIGPGVIRPVERPNPNPNPQRPWRIINDVINNAQVLRGR